MRAGYPDDAPGVVLGSPMLGGRGADRGPGSEYHCPWWNQHGLAPEPRARGGWRRRKSSRDSSRTPGVPVFGADVKGDPSGLAQPIDAHTSALVVLDPSW